MTRAQKIMLIAVTMFAIGAWGGFFYKKMQNHVTVITVDNTVESYKIAKGASVYQLTPLFWNWEAEGRKALIDMLLDDTYMTQAREDWQTGDKIDLEDLARHIMVIQAQAYNLNDITHARLVFTQLRGDANGLYVPEDATLYLNSKMRWDNLPFERFVEVVLHENMHHLLTKAVSSVDSRHTLYRDFMVMHLVGHYHTELAFEGQGRGDGHHAKNNPQEHVAYQMQEAAALAGIWNASVNPENMSAGLDSIRRLN